MNVLLFISGCARRTMCRVRGRMLKGKAAMVVKKIIGTEMLLLLVTIRVRGQTKLLCT